MRKFGKRILLFLVLSVAASLLFTACTEKNAMPETDRIVSVSVDGNAAQTIAKAELTEQTLDSVGEKGKIYLFGLAPWEKVADIATSVPLAEVRARSSVSFTVEHKTAEGELPLYKKYIIAVEKNGIYTPVTAARYVDDPGIAANKAIYSEALSVKGLAGVSAGVAEELHVSQTLIDVYPGEYLLNGADGYSCVIGAHSYKIPKALVLALDHKVKTFTDAGVKTYIRFIVNSDAASEDAIPLAVLAGFFADRYSEGEWGICTDYILAFDLGSPICDIYTTAALQRALYTAVQSKNSLAKTYFSVSCIFNTPEGGGSRALIEQLCEALAYNGNIPFGIAVNMEAASLLDSAVWEENAADSGLDTAYITVKNPEVLADFLHGEALLFNGEQREILITDFSVSSSSGYNGEDIQAAAIAYGYYKAELVNYTVGIIYSSYLDGENGSFGLCTYQNNVNELIKKRAHDVFASLNTDKGAEKTAFALPLIGVNRWEAVTGGKWKNNAVYAETSLKTYSKAPDMRSKEKLLFDFTQGSYYSFYPSDSVLFQEMVKKEEGYVLNLTFSGYEAEYAGASSLLEQGALEGGAYLKILLSAKSGEGNTVPVRVILFGENSGKKTVYSADAFVVSGENAEVYVDLTGLGREELAAIDRIKLLCKADGTAEGSMSVTDISLICKVLSPWMVVLWIFVGLVILAGLFFGFLYLRMLYYRNKRKKLRMIRMRDARSAYKNMHGALPSNRKNNKK